MKTKFFGALCATLLSTALFVACEKNGNDPEPNTGKILIQTTVKNPDGASGTSYLQLIPDFSTQTVDNRNGFQVGYSAGVRVYANDVFVFPEFGPDGTQDLVKYTYSSASTLQRTGTLALPPMSGAYGFTRYNNEKAYIPMYNLGVIWIFNPSTMIKTGEIDLTSYAFGDNSPEPSYSFIRDGLLYVPLDQVGTDWMPYPANKKAEVAIVDIATDEVVKVISESTSGLTFPTRPAFKDMIFTDEQNDLYIACAGGFGMDPRFPETGFICIRSGETEFDETASWDISQTTIQGTNYKPASLSNCKYIGNGKLCAYVVISELMTDNAYTARYSMPVLIDMKAKTVKKIDGIPISDGFAIFIDNYKDKVVFSAYGETQAGFFTYDPSTGEVEGPVVSTIGAPTFMYSFE